MTLDQDAIKLIYGKYHEVLYSDPVPLLEAYVITTVCKWTRCLQWLRVTSTIFDISEVASDLDLKYW